VKNLRDGGTKKNPLINTENLFIYLFIIQVFISWYQGLNPRPATELPSSPFLFPFENAAQAGLEFVILSLTSAGITGLCHPT
jgi:hypothetical protein